MVLKTKVGSVELQNPILVASGTFGYGKKSDNYFDINILGGIVTKSVTKHPREGNPPPRIVETPAGMLNSIGLANIGVERFVLEMLPEYKGLKTAVFMNIAGSTLEEYVEVLERVESVPNNLTGYEINISCPNVKKGGMEFGMDCELTAQLTSALRQKTEKLLIMKLSPNITDIAAIARSAADAGADAISAINTVTGMSINPETRKSNVYTKLCGLSGPAIKPIGIAAVYRVSQAVSIPVIGIGGITCGHDVAEYLLAGASAVQVGTANFQDPAAGLRILAEFRDYCEQNNVSDVSELIGGLRD
ncbi:MAG: dihydroorotate dehydrogenase [Fidelibacterota bacterium]